MAIARFLDCMCLALRASGLWLCYAMLQNLIPSFPWIAPPPSTLAQSKERKGSNFAIWQHWLYLEVAASTRQQLSFALEGPLTVADDDGDLSAEGFQSKTLEPIDYGVDALVTFPHDHYQSSDREDEGSWEVQL